MKIGTTRIVKSQRFVLVGKRPYVRKDGTDSEITTWEGECLICGTPYTQGGGANGIHTWPLRTCEQHRGRGNGRLKRIYREALKQRRREG